MLIQIHGPWGIIAKPKKLETGLRTNSAGGQPETQEPLHEGIYIYICVYHS